jgi:CDP-2,3-bis-(O-geranylgeranyl)-sn-glycerol synthase
MIPIAMAKLPIVRNWDYPLDFYKEFQGIRIFGDHKTIRGLISGIILAIIVAYAQKAIYLGNPGLQSAFAVDYRFIDPLVFGFLAGAGALMGDALKSFFKRRTAIKPGDTWFPFDQTDYIIGGLVCISFYTRFTLEQYILIAILYFGLHLLSTYVGYLLKLKKSPI